MPAELTPITQVTLMKYLYKAMENLGDTSGNVVLGWHEKVRLFASLRRERRHWGLSASVCRLFPIVRQQGSRLCAWPESGV